jgi:hypothetical protein
MGRKANTVQAQTLTLSISPQTRALLERIAGAGLFGKNAAEVATRFLDERVRAFLDNPSERKYLDSDKPV